MEKRITMRKKKTEINPKMMMKMWRFFPVLIKENIVEHMCIRDIVPFAKCSKQCQNLLTFVPIHLPVAFIDDRPYVGFRLIISSNHVGSFVYFSILATSRKFYVDQLKLYITTEENKNDVKNLIEKLTKARKSLKVKKLTMEIEVGHAELLTGFLEICDPSRIESIEIPKLYSQEIYEELVKTPQWRNSKRVSLMGNQGLNLPNVNIDDFLHFENVQLRVERLDTDDAVKFIQNFRNASELIKFSIISQKPMQKELIRQKIETSWDGDWKRSEHPDRSYIIHPTKPDHVFHFEFFVLFPFLLGGWSLLDEFDTS